jgi:hypothetical protein
MLPFLPANLILFEVKGSNHLVKSTLDSVTLHGDFVAIVEDGKRLREYPPARIDALIHACTT